LDQATKQIQKGIILSCIKNGGQVINKIYQNPLVT